MTIAILSWGSPETLTQTLQSYNEFGLDQLDEEKLIYFQEISGEDIETARKFGYKWIGSVENVGIAEGYKRLLDAATGEFFLFLENDWRLIEHPTLQIVDAENILYEDQMDIFRFRHRDIPGHPLWTKQFEGHEIEHPTHLLDSIHWTDPDKFEQINRYKGVQTFNEWYWTTSKYANWTNNPHMAYTDFLRRVAPHMGNRDLEADLQSWWEQQDFRVAQSNGLFTHDRID